MQVGDDLRQDILVLQMIKVMEKIWLRAGLDLKLVMYDCVATGQDHGEPRRARGGKGLNSRRKGLIN